MRALRWILTVVLITLSAAAGAQQFRVPPLARVVDLAGVLSPAAREQLTRLLEEHERRSSNQVVVVTLASLGGADIAEIGLQLGRGWKLGTRQNNNGVLLVVAPAERKLRIEVGYGLEGNLPDARAFQIINTQIVPRFRAGDIEGGIVNGTMAIIASVEGTYQPPKESADPLENGLVPILFVVGMGVIVLVSVYRNGGGFGGGRGASPYGRRAGPWGRGPSIVLPSSSGGWSGGRSSGGRSFGGGGGSFGGGGATGSW